VVELGLWQTECHRERSEVILVEIDELVDYTD
jgi:hypothetical protein